MCSKSHPITLILYDSLPLIVKTKKLSLCARSCRLEACHLESKHAGIQISKIFQLLLAPFVLLVSSSIVCLWSLRFLAQNVSKSIRICLLSWCLYNLPLPFLYLLQRHPKMIESLCKVLNQERWTTATNLNLANRKNLRFVD